MKPKNIFLIRHGESLGNVNHDIYKTVPDWKIELTDKGRQQAKEAAKHLLPQIIKVNEHPTTFLNHSCQFYISPWYRTRQTSEIIMQELKKQGVEISSREDPRLREQEFGNYQTEDSLTTEKERKTFSRFYYRIPQGESGADVYDRMSTFLETLHRDFEKPNFPNNVIIVTHGVTMLIFLTRFFHWSPEEFDSIKTPANCGIISLQHNLNTNKYELITKLKKRN